MTDTQWRRYEVFVQEADGKPYLDYGSVHAPDVEMALLNARDVFARRPECTSMWVVPADAIYSVTASQLDSPTQANIPEQTENMESYYVCCKTRQSGMLTLEEEVEACSPAEALRAWLNQPARGSSPLVCWVFPAREVLKSDRNDIDSYYRPALDKPFRLSSDFHTVTDMKKIRQTPVSQSPERKQP